MYDYKQKDLNQKGHHNSNDHLTERKEYTWEDNIRSIMFDLKRVLKILESKFTQ